MYYMDLYMVILSSLLLLIGIFIGVAFFTLMERKVLGYIQVRKGPNKVSLFGVLQPMGDAIKLFSKEHVYPYMSNFIFYYYSPMIGLFISLFMWLGIPLYVGFLFFDFNILFIVCCSSLSVYFIMISGWASNSIYSLLGSLRSVAQTISYEVSFIMILVFFLILISGFSIYGFMCNQKYIWFVFLGLPLSMIMYSSMLAETNRTPFDFSEGESELVSGFNTEYSGGLFALIFLAEYTSMFFMSMFFVIIFLGGDFFSVYFFMKVLLVCFSFLWVRGTLPRFRYDKLMGLAWKIYLSISLSMYVYIYGLIIFLNSFLI